MYFSPTTSLSWWLPCYIYILPSRHAYPDSKSPNSNWMAGVAFPGQVAPARVVVPVGNTTKRGLVRRSRAIVAERSSEGALPVVGTRSIAVPGPFLQTMPPPCTRYNPPKRSRIPSSSGARLHEFLAQAVGVNRGFGPRSHGGAENKRISRGTGAQSRHASVRECLSTSPPSSSLRASVSPCSVHFRLNTGRLENAHLQCCPGSCFVEMAHESRLK